MKPATKTLLLTFLCYAAILAFSTVFFISLFHTPLLKDLKVLFYRGCVFLVLSALVSACLTFLAARVWKSLHMGIKDMLVVCALFGGLTLGWFTLLPVTVERSISVYMLSYMDQNDTEGLTAEKFGDIFYQKYIQDYGAFRKRFEEQKLSGNIVEAEDGSGYKITKNGRFIIKLFRLCANLFNTEKWLVYPNQY